MDPNWNPRLRIERRGPVTWTRRDGWRDADGHGFMDFAIEDLIKLKQIRIFVIQRDWLFRPKLKVAVIRR